MPSLPGRDIFKGVAIHSTRYHDPKDLVGKDVVVVGAGNTAIDICQETALARARSVTMVQRSSTCVVSREKVNQSVMRVWVPGVPIEVGDLKQAFVPVGYIKKVMVSRPEAEAWAEEEELHAKLRKGGVALNLGPEGAGQQVLAFERGGGKSRS